MKSGGHLLFLIMQNTHSLYEIDLSQITVLLLFNAINVDLTGKKGLWKYRGRSSSHILFKVSGVGFGLYFKNKEKEDYMGMESVN